MVIIYGSHSRLVHATMNDTFYKNDSYKFSQTNTHGLLTEVKSMKILKVKKKWTSINAGYDGNGIFHILFNQCNFNTERLLPNV